MKSDYVEKYRIFGLKLAFFRKKAGFTQQGFAEATNLSINFVAQIEAQTAGPRGVSLETLFRMADVLDIPVSKLLEDD